ncbi:CPBP family intramembrane glutamic endopeptidase [Flavobacterium sandaracinum]|uniref:CPBP family intramembrane metalloprotease n=1 Tax=Flavobacterium sandaracinum TaxID=2541733 RepID=A0A4R5CU47_9FLAO|nr:CPBP family intramembrane metalloprotease [Flavobacterium sandaracinum]
MAYLSVALAALGEELFFRGYLLQYALDTKEENNLIKNIFFSTLASFLFSIAHMRFDLFIYQYFFFSLICSLIFIKCKNIGYTVSFHFFLQYYGNYKS